MSGEEREIRERFERLATAAVDGELGPEEARELETILRDHPGLRAEMEEQKQVKEVLGTMRFVTPPEEVWDRYRTGVLHRLERGIGWLLLGFGLALLIGYGAYELILALIEEEISLVVKLGILGTALGVAILLVSLVRERMFLRTRERYDEVER